MRWGVRGGIALFLGGAAFVGGMVLPSNGLILLAIGLGIGGVVLLVLSRWMQAVTLPGAMIRAMLAAYRRTLEKTMAQARSMDQVVAEAGLAVARDARPGRRLGRRRSGSTSRSSTSSSAASTTSRTGARPRVRPTCRSGTEPAADRTAAAPVGSGVAAAGCSRSGGVPNLGGDDGRPRRRSGTRPSSSGGGGGGGFGGGGSGGGGGGSGGGF